ncbi:hypothetical protein BIV57_15175 [Mangrovactinospora gilvigrisea]|uniref:DUF885 domain-containing protein n=1 Tax=Mangrovactinospora gilvigrisea TaxID=1428644 RepID=A0A1J7CAG2_9ACTN|nr:DUF885 domain-containing protein [Mangrovactinospora gilvigrisea]OIV36642.1 hypothetical protein BIV57_15175 [Mangrovactinospora gilvigrisea]
MTSSSGSDRPASPETSRPTVDEVAERYVDAYAALDPFGATSAGLPGYDAESTDYTPEGFAARAELDRRTLAELDGAVARDERERVAGEAMRERLSLHGELGELGLDRRMNVLESPFHESRMIYDLMPRETEEDWANIAARLRDLPSVLAAYRRSMDADRAGGVLGPARRQVAGVAEQARRLRADRFFEELVGEAPAAVPDALRADLAKAAEGASASYGEFAGYLETAALPSAPTEDAVGRDVYAVASRYFLGAAVDLDETYAWGLDELHRIEAEMAEVSRRIAPDGGGSVDAAVAALDADPARKLAGTDALRGWMQELADRTIAELSGVHFDIPEPVKRIECMIAPTKDGGIYYTPPSDDFSRPGRMWWSVPPGVEEFSTWRETTTVFHEGVPGHHLQCAQVVQNREVLNRWQRLLCWVSGHGEGWALYAERLMGDLGRLDDPADRLGMLDGQGFRAARVVVDIGLHLKLDVPERVVREDGIGAGPWTPEKAFVFLQRHCRMQEEFLRFELDRYLGWPGQAPSYKVGERIWLAAREEVRARQGAAFDLKRFHKAALDLGSIGLDPLREALGRL